DNATFSRSFTVSVTPVNDTPTLDTIGNGTIAEDVPQQTVNLTGITAGGGESQTLRVSAISSNTALIPNPSIAYTSANATGSIAFTPIADKSGTSVITVTIEDAGLDNDLATSADNLSYSRSFTVTVSPVNDLPTLTLFGDYANPVTLPADAYPDSFDFGDLDNDNDIDIVAMAHSTGKFYVYKNNGKGTFSLFSVFDRTAVAPGAHLKLSDLDNDGDLDILLSHNYNGGRIQVYDNNGTGNFSIGKDIDMLGVTPILPRAIDLNKDGLSDLMTSNFNGNSISIALRQNGTNFASATVYPLTSEANSNPYYVHTVDLDNDGYLDLVIPTSAGGGSVVMFNLGNGTFGRKSIIAYPAYAMASTMLDIDKDGDLDLLQGEVWGSGKINLIRNNGAGAFSFVGTWADVGNCGISHLTHVDVNADGIEDVVVTTIDAGIKYLSVATPTLTPTTILPATYPNLSLAILADLNADGSLDFASNSQTGNYIVVRNTIPQSITIAEDAPQQSSNLLGITAGGGESQPLKVTAISDKPSLIPNPSVSYTSANTTGSIAFAPVADQFGTAVITVTVEDGGLDNDLATTTDNATFSRSFTVTVNPVNDTPTLDTISNGTIAEDAPQQTVNLTGITAGGGESQTLRVSATSSNTALIPNPSIAYTSANTTGSIAFTPIADKSGTSVITVTVEDAGLDNDLATSADNLSYTRSFTVTVNPVNDLPTIDGVANLTIFEDAAKQTLNLSGITAGGAESQTLRVSATSSNTALIPIPTVTYTTPNATGSIALTPIADQSGVSVITVTVEDAGLDNDLATTADNATFSRSFTVTVNPVNDIPSLNTISNVTIAEDAPQQTVNLTGITAGGGESQTLRVTATSSSTAIIPNPNVSYTSANTTGSIAFTPIANQFGTAVITISVEDGGLDNDLQTTADNATFSRSFTVTVNPVNDTPTLDAISDVTIAEDAPQQTVNLTGITAGGGESQTLRVSVTSVNTALIPTPTVTYTTSNVTGSIDLTPIVDQSGVSVITVTVEDAGLDNDLATSADNATFSRSFTVTVNPVNDIPTLNAIDNLTISEDALQQTVNLTGITAGGGESQALKVTATSDKPSLIHSPSVSYTSANTAGSIAFKPVADQFGTAVITVSVEDGGLDNDLATTADNAIFSRSFTVSVTPVNDTPTLDAISDVTIAEDAPQQTVNLTGITAGGSESQTLRVSATSSNTALIPSPGVTYTSANPTGSIAFTPISDKSGTSVITVTVEDGGVDNDLATTADNLSYRRSFTVTVTPVNDLPTMDGVANLTIFEDASKQTINLSGITAGGAESQPLRVIASSSNTALIPIPLVTYTTPNATGSIVFTPIADQSGESIITVTVEDAGLDNDLSTSTDNATFSRSFTVTVSPINDIPSLNTISNVTISEDAPQQTVNLTGITAGGGESQTLRVTATSSSTAIIPNPNVSYTSANTTGSIAFTPIANQFG
ncbi:MAG: VCBS repeat-containing protein, partial [Planctomycetes bacterium]|nr:VCBS repeat-containing protein [Planctomycetota bacterium]